MKISGVKAAFIELDGNGTFEQRGKRIDFRAPSGQLIATWWAATSADAAQQIRLFRAVPKYLTRAEVDIDDLV